MASRSPWPALWALVVGFFMLLVDSTIVAIANPAMMRALDTNLTAVLWVTSAYLLAYAVPMLITGRLGDRFGPKRVYLAGLIVFTAASAWCGLSAEVGVLIAARTVQGIGAALMTPQTLAVITRTFPPEQRGPALGMWAAAAGLATLVGPIIGGVLVDSFGWEWIFFVNVPVGIVAMVLAWRLVPDLETRAHRFDWVGVVLSAVGLFCLVFGVQEGPRNAWGAIAAPWGTAAWLTVPGLIAAGLVVLAAFVVWQRVTRSEPLLPLRLFRDRDFSIANVAITLTGVAFVATPLPLAFTLQVARGLTPTQSALVLAPSAVVTALMAPVVGRVVDRVDPRVVVPAGFGLAAVSLWWMSALLAPGTSTWLLLVPATLLGLGMSGVWAPLAATATRTLDSSVAGAGSGFYNTTRQIGAVLGSAAIAALMNARLAAELPGFDPAGAEHVPDGTLPASAQHGFADAMAQALWLPIAAYLLGAAFAIWFAKPGLVTRSGRGASPHVIRCASAAAGAGADAADRELSA